MDRSLAGDGSRQSTNQKTKELSRCGLRSPLRSQWPRQQLIDRLVDAGASKNIDHRACDRHFNTFGACHFDKHRCGKDTFDQRTADDGCLVTAGLAESNSERIVAGLWARTGED